MSRCLQYIKTNITRTGNRRSKWSDEAAIWFGKQKPSDVWFAILIAAERRRNVEQRLPGPNPGRIRSGRWATYRSRDIAARSGLVAGSASTLSWLRRRHCLARSRICAGDAEMRRLRFALPRRNRAWSCHAEPIQVLLNPDQWSVTPPKLTGMGNAFGV